MIPRASGVAAHPDPSSPCQPMEPIRARAAAGLRTSAAHARWEEIKRGNVEPVVQFTRELMSAHLG